MPELASDDWENLLSVNVFDDVREFNEACGVRMNESSGPIYDDEKTLALNLIAEELDELADAVRKSDLVEIADAIADSIYVTAGLVLRYGVTPNPEFAKIAPDVGGPPVLRDRLIGSVWVLDAMKRARALAEAAWGGSADSVVWPASCLIWDLSLMARQYGIPLEAVWREVQRSNMAKVVDGRVVRDPVTNKVLKPNNWSAPDVAGVLAGASVQ